MKKRLFAIVAVIMSLFLSVSIFSGCNLLDKNNERDLAQTVATIRISEDAPLEKVEKKQIVMAYYNYGYYYVQNGTYSLKQVIEMLVDNAISTRILVQNAISEFDADANYSPKDAQKDKWDVERYLTTQDVVESGKVVKLSDVNYAKYQVAQSINSFIDGYEEHSHDEKSDAVDFEERAVPTGAVNASENLTDAQMSEYITKAGTLDGVEIGADISERRVAYNKVIKMLEQNSLLGEYDGDIRTTDYYKELLKSAEETRLIEKYEEIFKESVRNKVTFADLENKYVEMYNAQKNMSSADYSTALESVTATNPMLYHPQVGYGYVYNLLLGVSETQEILISNLKDNADRVTLRRQILSNTTVTDLRSPWIYSGYDFDLASKKFTGDYAIAGENSFAFQGDVQLLKEKTDEHTKDEYRATPKEMSLDEFLEVMDNYLYGAPQTSDDLSSFDGSYYKKVTTTAGGANFIDKVNELLFAFSTDPGSLNTDNGYIVKPTPDLGEDETYMQEFADAGRTLLTMGGNSYIMVATDYGYHVMFYSQALSVDQNKATLSEYLGTGTDWEAKYNDMLANWEDYDDSDDYLYNLAKLHMDVDNAYNNEQSKIINKYLYDGTSVVKYSNTYQDLINA